MTLKPVSKLALNYLLLGVLYMVSDQVYRYFKFKGSMSGTSFFFYDNFWFGWYYLLSMLYFLLVGATLMTKDKYLVSEYTRIKIIKLTHIFRKSSPQRETRSSGASSR